MNSAKVQSQIRQKKKLMERHKQQKQDQKESSNGLPSGQTKALSWIVLDLKGNPNTNSYDPWIEPEKFSILCKGLADGRECRLSLEDLKELPTRRYKVDWHCVTGWSFAGLILTGIPMKDLLKRLNPDPSWVDVLQVSVDGYAVNTHREDVEYEEAFLCIGDADGNILPVQHGGIRLVIPALFGWKSAKWLTELHFLREHKPGFWEKLGCHSRGRVAFDERFAPGHATTVWSWLIWMSDQYRVYFGYHVWVWVMKFGGALLGVLSSVYVPLKRLRR